MEKSESIKSIAGALMLFQMKMGKIKKDATNPFFKSKYASLSNILENIDVALSECDLAFTQMPDGNYGLTTLLMHIESGEYFQSTYFMKPTKDDPQGAGSCITYQRRYALTAMLGLNIEDDDDGNKASEKDLKKENDTVSKKDDKPWLNKDTDSFSKAKLFLEKGQGTMEDIRKKYKISKEIESLLKGGTK